jgi:8-oxo-dGTP pyrophosphatase MutT (NUDIX family)
MGLVRAGPEVAEVRADPAPHVELQPAATVMLVRDTGGGSGGSIEVLMLRRHPDSVFAADAWVFPGGRVDDADQAGVPMVAGPSDHEASRALGLPAGGLAYWVAAARECFEEAGILLARHPETGAWLDTTDAGGSRRRYRGDTPRPPGEWSSARLARNRRDVHAGAVSLGAVLEAEGLVLDLSGVHYVSHWITPPGRTARRFDTRFFVAVVPPGQVASHDAAETVESIWTTPADALARGADGEIVLVIPTIANLKALAQFSSTEELVAAARAIGHVPMAAPRFRGDPSVPAAVLVPPKPDPEFPCPT